LTTSNCFHNFNAKSSDQGRIHIYLGGRFQQYSAVKAHYAFTTVREMKYTSQHCCDKKWTANWPYIANAVFRIVQNHGERSCFRRFYGGRSRPLDPPLVQAYL